MGTMREMSREMMKAGIIDEMITDAMDSAFGDEDLVEEETAQEIDRVLQELAVVDAAQMPAAASAPIPAEDPVITAILPSKFIFILLIF